MTDQPNIGTLNVGETQIEAGAYEITFKFMSTDATPAQITTTTLRLTNYESNKLVTAVYNATSGVKRTDAVSTDIKPFTVSAEWTTGKAPTQEDDVAYLKGKIIRGAQLKAEGNVKLRANNLESADLSSTLDLIITVNSNDVNSLNVSFEDNGSTVSPAAFRIATNNPNGGEFYEAEEKTGASLYGQTAESHTDANAVYHTADALKIEVATTLSIGTN